MSYLESFILGLIQGITEFLPISSSGHLLMFRSMLNIDSFDLLIEVSLHLGTLLAIFIYWKDFYLKEIDKFMDGDRKMFFNVLIGSIPAGIVGLLYKNQIKEYFFDIGSISYLAPIYFIMFLLIFFSKYFHNNNRNEISLINAFIIGIAQSIAILPGFSRSGLTIITALFMGISFKSSFKFSFLLSIPILLFAGIQLIISDYNLIFSDFEIMIKLGFGMLISVISGYYILVFLENVIDKNKFWYFSFYCLLISILLLSFSYGY